jgi:hypothetical protein
MGIGRLGSVTAPLILGLLVGSALGLSWNFYAIAIPGLIGAALILLVPSAEPDRPDGVRRIDRTTQCRGVSGRHVA